jgi:hypothetical protein
MPRWAVIRVAAYDGHVALAALKSYAPITMKVDPHAPAAAPEWEIAVQDRTEDDLRRVLGDKVLASKTVLDAPLEPA